MQRVADYIMDRLSEEGVKDLFMVTGRGVLYLSDAAARKTELNTISVHHEQAGAYAAMASSQMGRTGACLVSTGCGSTNAMTGVLCAWQDSIPCVFVSGQNMLRETTRYTGIPLRTYGSQEADIVRLVEPITKYAVMLTDPALTAYEMDKALFLMKNARQGPIWLDIPLDIQNMRVDPQALLRLSDEEKVLLSATTTPEKELASLAENTVEKIRKASRPVLLIGNGIRLAEAAGELGALAESWNIPVVYAPSAADIYGSANRLSIGAAGGLGGSREGNFALQNADLILSVGCSLSSMLTGSDPAKFAREAEHIVVDIDPVQHSKAGVRIDTFIHADAKAFLSLLKKEPPVSVAEKWVAQCLHWKEIFPLGKEEYCNTGRIDLYYLAEQLSLVLPEDGAVVSDAGFEELILPSALHLKTGQRCIHPAAQGAMGYALPAGIGVYMAQKCPVVIVTGDGSVMMNLQELQTVVHYQLPLKILIINNNVYAVIRKRQMDLFRDRTIGTDPQNGVSCPDFHKIADGFGIPYVKINNKQEFDDQLEAVLATEGPVICEIDAVMEQRYLHESIARDQNRKIVRRPIEDLSPFLEREQFLQEMIIEPIDQ